MWWSKLKLTLPYCTFYLFAGSVPFRKGTLNSGSVAFRPQILHTCRQLRAEGSHYYFSARELFGSYQPDDLSSLLSLSIELPRFFVESVKHVVISSASISHFKYQAFRNLDVLEVHRFALP